MQTIIKKQITLELFQLKIRLLENFDQFNFFSDVCEKIIFVYKTGCYS